MQVMNTGCSKKYSLILHPRCRALLVILSICLVLQCPCRTKAHLNLYLSRPEVRRLFGLDAELFYVREGVINAYALNFTVPVPANLSKLFFTWHSLVKRPMLYVAQVDYDNGEAMALPALNISDKGIVPTVSSTFSLTMPCTGTVDAEVQVNLHLNISSSTSKNRPSNFTKLTIKRKKICLKGEMFRPRNDSIFQRRPSWSSSAMPLGTLYLATGVACTTTVLVITLAWLVYLKIRKSRDQQSLNCRYYNGGPGFLGTAAAAAGDCSSQNLPESLRSGPTRGGLAPSLTSNSYATIASIKKFPQFQSIDKKEVGKVHTGSSFKGSVHYASSPLSHLYSQVASGRGGFSPSPSLVNSKLSLQTSWCGGPPASLRSQISWLDPRHSDPTEKAAQLAVDRWRVVVGESVQEGTFGRIHQGVCHDPAYTQKALNVLVKTVSGDASPAQANLVLREGLLLGGLHHSNLLPVLGVCTQDHKRPLLLYPQQGVTNLKITLRGSNSSNGGVGLSNNEGAKLLTRDAVHVAIGVCQGLIFLHQQRILHKDVATRNCMIDKDLEVKITDTALSRDLFPADYHCLGDNENRPVKWLSLEAIARKQFTAATDVWMFGVFLWELMTSAQQPYFEIDPFEMAAYLRDGYRLCQPHSCPDDLFGVMAICWAPDPQDRPELYNLLNCLKEFHATLSTFV